MYTDAMRKAFHSITPPKDFGVNIIDNDSFLTIKLNEEDSIQSQRGRIRSASMRKDRFKVNEEGSI